jgi:peptidoglycan DL-endopeptidase CwlO
MKQLLTILLVLSVAAVSRGDDDTWHNVYHSLKHFGHHVKDKFSDDDEKSSKHTPDSTHHRSHQSDSEDHPAKKHAAPSPAPSSTPEIQEPAPKATPVPIPVGTPPPIQPTPAPTPLSPPTAEQTSDSSEGQVENRPKPDAEKPAESDQKATGEANVATIKPEELTDFSSQPEKVQQLIRSALDLTERHLNYQYGSSDPSTGGMDCSGFIYYILTQTGYKNVPRDSSQQYAWVRQNNDFQSVLSRSQDSFELKNLKPGDLMFWSGTYKSNRDIPITHVMIYLGKVKETGKPVMVGASDGRSYNGIRRSGVSVFDFKMPTSHPDKNDSELVAKFEGYGAIPGLRGQADNNPVSLIDRSDAEKPDAEESPTPHKKPVPKKKKSVQTDD